jgi:hypothetical protein
VIAGEAEPGDAPAGDISKFQVAADGENLGERRAACVGCAEDAADAGARDMSDSNVILFEDLQDAEVRKPTGESAA